MVLVTIFVPEKKLTSEPLSLSHPHCVVVRSRQ